MSFRKIVVLSSHIAAMGGDVLDHGVVGQAPGVAPRLQLAAPLVRGDVLVADFAAGLLADDVGDLLLGEQLMARRVDDWGVGVVCGSSRAVAHRSAESVALIQAGRASPKLLANTPVSRIASACSSRTFS